MSDHTSDQLPPTPSLTSEQHEAIHRAVTYVANAICQDPAKFYLMGDGTESRRRLCIAYALIHGITFEVAEERLQPDERKYRKYCAQLDEDRDALQDLRSKSKSSSTRVEDLRRQASSLLGPVERDARHFRQLQEMRNRALADARWDDYDALTQLVEWHESVQELAGNLESDE